MITVKVITTVENFYNHSDIDFDRLSYGHASEIDSYLSYEDLKFKNTKMSTNVFTSLQTGNYSGEWVATMVTTIIHETE